MNGYGCHSDTPLGWTYLPKIVCFIQKQRPDYIILCGGFTQRKSAPGVSEARLMFDFIDSHYSGALGFILEEDSYTSLENIRNAAQRIRERGDRRVEITIFCEATRALSVVWLARRFMSDLVESIDDIIVETASWERADPFKQVWKMIYNRFAARFPHLARRERKRRIRRAEQI